MAQKPKRVSRVTQTQTTNVVAAAASCVVAHLDPRAHSPQFMHCWRTLAARCCGWMHAGSASGFEKFKPVPAPARTFFGALCETDVFKAEGFDVAVFKTLGLLLT